MVNTYNRIVVQKFEIISRKDIYFGVTIILRGGGVNTHLYKGECTCEYVKLCTSLHTSFNKVGMSYSNTNIIQASSAIPTIIIYTLIVV